MPAKERMEAVGVLSLWTFLVSLIAMSSNPSSAATLRCSQSSNCTVSRSVQKIELLCPSLRYTLDTELTVQLKPEEEADFSCTPNTSIDYGWLAGCPLGPIKRLSTKNCPLPHEVINLLLTKLSISNISLLYIEDGLKNVNLSENYFQNIPNLTHLLMPNNELRDLPAHLFNGLTKLTNLDLKFNSLTLSNDDLAPLTKLKRLELGSNNIQQLTPGIFRHLNELEFLNLWENKITSLTREMFSGLGNLTSLDISGNNIAGIPFDTFGDLAQLQNISLIKNSLTGLPQNVFADNKQLKVVKLAHNERLEKIPSGLFSYLPYLKEVHIQECKISVLPEDIFWGSPNISFLDMSGNGLTTLPALLFRDATNLQTLNMRKNKLISIPSTTFKYLTVLRVLDLDHNQLSSINDEIFSTLQKLEELNFSNNSLQEVHIHAFQEMLKLKDLNLSHNQLTFKPRFRDFIGAWSPLQKCKQLEILDLSHNNIEEIFADWMYTLQKLKELDLSFNNITAIEATDLQFTSSELIVNLENNRIKTINLHLLELLSLEHEFGKPIQVKLQGNELQCECGIYHMLRYLEKDMFPGVYKMVNFDVRNLTCIGPPDIAGIPLADLKSPTFTCPLRTNAFKCADACKCLSLPKGNSIIVNCTGVGFSEIPELLTPRNKTRVPIHILLDHNNLHLLPEESFTNYKNITKLSLSHNHISRISDNVLPKTLMDVRLDNNNLTSLNLSLLEKWTNKTNLTLHNNPWSCECDPHALDLLNFLQSSYKQVDLLNNVTCKDGRILSQLKVQDICPLLKIIVIGICSTIAVFGIFLGLLAALYFRYQKEVRVWLYAHKMCLWFVREKELDKDKTYDAFISYSHQDEDYVTSKLIPELENGTPAFKLCVHYRDWVAGEFITTQITRSVEDSKRTIVVLSENFIKSEWGKLEFRAAHKQALTDKLARVIVIVFGDLGPLENLDHELRTYLSTNTYIKWDDPWFWDKLRYALPHPPKIPKKHLSKVTDKMELIHSPLPAKATTPPTDISRNPLEIINNFSNRNCKITNELNDNVKSA